MVMSDKTREKVGLPLKSEVTDALGVTSRVTPVGMRELSKFDEGLLQSHALTIEDDPFDSLSTIETGLIIKPTYNPHQLASLCQTNNTLGPCVAAMEVNIDGTGWVIEAKEAKTEDEVTPEEEQQIEWMTDFFNEPFPKNSFTTIRRKLRKDLEKTGMGYLEVIRSLGGDIVFINYVDSRLVRLAKLTRAQEREFTVMRQGQEFNVKLAQRPRRYAMIIGRKVRYFKDFGIMTKLDMVSGLWEGESAKAGGAGDDVKVAPNRSATELIMFGVDQDTITPYFVPRWIAQVPSVLGSRKAEEFNLEFFDHGGLPPALIMIQGGALTNDAREALTNYLSGKAKFKQRGVIVEVFSTSGDLNSAGQVRVTVERFGAERQGDSMFEKYDERCEQRVRGAFRLPKLFVGKTDQLNFATAQVSYMLAEAQVFKPERDEFDEIINVKLMTEMAPLVKFRSLPIQLTDVATQLTALDKARGEVERESWVENLNEAAKLTLIAKEDEDEDELMGRVQDEINARLNPTGLEPQKEVDEDDIDAVKTDDKGRIVKMSDNILNDLAEDWSKHLLGLGEFTDDSIKAMRILIKSLVHPTRSLFDSYVAMRVAGGSIIDVEGTGELLAGATDMEEAEKASHPKKKKKVKKFSKTRVRKIVETADLKPVTYKKASKGTESKIKDE